jgi:hypothetical protein
MSPTPYGRGQYWNWMLAWIVSLFKRIQKRDRKTRSNNDSGTPFDLSSQKDRTVKIENPTGTGFARTGMSRGGEDKKRFSYVCLCLCLGPEELLKVGPLCAPCNLRLHMCVCTYVYVYTHIYMCTYVCICICICIYTHVHMYIYMCVCMCVYICICICACVCVYT